MKQLNNIEEVKKELKRLASIKCRLKKQRGKAGYEIELQRVIEEENKVKELRDRLSDSKKSVTNYTIQDIEHLSYEEVLKAIKSIQSKKSNTKWLTEIEGDNDEYRNACKIEDMLKLHRDKLAPQGSTLRQRINEIIEQSDTLSKEEIVELLKGL